MFEYASTHKFIVSVASQMIYEDLKKVAANWENFGTMVDVDTEAIKENSKKTADCFKEVIKSWLNGSQENVTKKKLAKAVEVAGNKGLAGDILADPQFVPNLPYLLKKLHSMRSKYNVLGSQLGVPSSHIRTLELVRVDVEYCMNEVVMKWFENENSKPSMEVLKEALKYINQFGLYQDLEKKYKGKNFCTLNFKEAFFQLAFIS